VALVAGAAAGRGPPLKLHASAWRLATPGKRRWIAVEFAAIVAWLAAAWFLLEVSCLWWHATAMAVGTARPAATEFSFLVGIPTLLAAGALQVFSSLVIIAAP